MSNSASQPIPYETPTLRRRPRRVVAIAIAGICVGTATALFRAVSLVSAILWIINQRRGHWLNLRHQIYGPASAFIFEAFAIFLLTTSIGCLSGKSWARRWMMRYAWCYLIALLLDVIASCFTFLPVIHQAHGTIAPADHATAQRIFAFNLILTAVGSVLPVLIVMNMDRAKVKAAFGE